MTKSEKRSTSLRTHIRWMIRRDMEEVLSIEKRCFEFPWSLDDFVRCLRQRNCIGMVAEHRDYVLGYMVYGLHGSSLEIFNFAVDPLYHREGIGRCMIEKLKSKLSTQRRYMLLADVRESNLDAQLFMRAMCFRARAVVRESHDNSPEDAYRFCYSINRTRRRKDRDG